MTPNLFTYATSELSQDAALCWLLAWADARHAHTDPQMHEAGRTVLRALLEAAGLEASPDDAPVVVERQKHNIDILAFVGTDTVVAIEDKVHSAEHSDQLARYRAEIEKHYGRRKMALIYLKTGDQSSYAEVVGKGWHVLHRSQLLALLRPLRETTTNATFADFVDHLQQLEDAVMDFATKPTSEWDDASWRGFFMAVQPTLGGHWDYVANPSGGFMGMWWGFVGVDGGTLYPQMERGELVLKIGVDNDGRRSELRDLWVARILDALGPMGFVRPKRLGHGSVMTVAKLDRDYRACDGGRVNLEQTLALLEDVTKAVRDCARGRP